MTSFSRLSTSAVLVRDALCNTKLDVLDDLFCMECVFDSGSSSAGGGSVSSKSRSCRSCLCQYCGLAKLVARRKRVLSVGYAEDGSSSAPARRDDDALLQCRRCFEHHEMMTTRFHERCAAEALAVDDVRATSISLACRTCGVSLTVAIKDEQMMDGDNVDAQAFLKIKDEGIESNDEDVKNEALMEPTQCAAAKEEENYLLALLATDPRVPFEVLHHGAMRFGRRLNTSRRRSRTLINDDDDDDDDDEDGTMVQDEFSKVTEAEKIALVRQEWPSVEVRFFLPAYHVPASHHWQYPPPLDDTDISGINTLLSKSATPAALRKVLGPQLTRYFHQSKVLRTAEAAPRRREIAPGVGVETDDASPTPKLPPSARGGGGSGGGGSRPGAPCLRRKRMVSTGSLLPNEWTKARTESSAQMSLSLDRTRETPGAIPVLALP